MDKKNIPKIKKQEIWYHYIGEDIGRTKCFCCNINDIRQLEFHCGHIIPKSKGGEMSLQNLRPICSKCNLSMGNENMIDFMKRLSYCISQLQIIEEVKIVDEIIISFIIRNNQWGHHVNVFDTIKETNMIVCPWGHWKDTNKLFDEGKFNNEKFSNIFINKINIDDYILLFDREYKYAMVLKIISSPIAEKTNIIILRNNNCKLHKILLHNCEDCNNSVELVFTEKYFENNSSKFIKYLNEDYHFENMYEITRKVEIIKTINNDIYNKYKCIQNSIIRPKDIVKISLDSIQ